MSNEQGMCLSCEATSHIQQVWFCKWLRFWEGVVSVVFGVCG